VGARDHHPRTRRLRQLRRLGAKLEKTVNERPTPHLHRAATRPHHPKR
jgi:hypothetical protein